MRIAGRPGNAIAAAVLAAVVGPVEAAERPWIEVRSPHFTVVSDAGKDKARDTALEFEKMRAVFKVLFPWAPRDETRPVVILAAREHDTLLRFDPKVRASLFAVGPDADFVALRAGAGLIVSGDDRINPYREALAGYARSALAGRFGARIPLWYEEGIVEIFSNSLVFGNDVQVGRVVTTHLSALVFDAARDALGPGRGGRVTLDAFPASAIVPLERLIHARRIELERADGVARRSFAAQSWVFAHFLMFGEKGAHRPKFDRLGALLSAGRSRQDATEEALGDVEQLERAYREYIRKKQLHFQRLELAVPGSERWSSRVLPPTELATLEGRLEAATR